MEILLYILLGVVGLLFLYLKAYSSEKGKNKALKEDIGDIENKKQEVVTKHTMNIDSNKAELALNSEKRNKLYDSKFRKFEQYFELLDIFHAKSNKIFTTKFPPIFSSFMGVIIKDNCSDIEEENAWQTFMNGMQELMNELNMEHLNIKTRMNSIRLISSKQMDLKLDKLELEVKRATDTATEMLKIMSTLDFLKNQEIIKPFELELKTCDERVRSAKEEIRQQMKLELDQI